MCLVLHQHLSADTFELAPPGWAQAALFGKNGMLIMAHGAGLSNAFTLPKRSCVIEVYPRGLWCDIYRKVRLACRCSLRPMQSSSVTRPPNETSLPPTDPPTPAPPSRLPAGQMMSAQGAHVIPIYSTLVGPKVRASQQPSSNTSS